MAYNGDYSYRRLLRVIVDNFHFTYEQKDMQ